MDDRIHRRVSTTATFETIRDAASSGENDKPSKTTTLPYRTTLEQLWMIEELPAWTPSRNRLRRLARSPVRQLADPALAARLLAVDTDGLISGTPPGQAMPSDGTLLGALFESLVTLSVRTYAQANEARVHHLRTRAGEHEVDIIVERGDGRIVALDVKLSATIDDNDTRHLKWLADTIGDDLLDAAIITSVRTVPQYLQARRGGIQNCSPKPGHRPTRPCSPGAYGQFGRRDYPTAASGGAFPA